tara:strand:- start:4306 stop:4929 length:624 start_codon:yes stop_codon:yes gene_type:complete
MNKDIILVHNPGYQLSRIHAEAAKGKVSIITWDNQGNPDAIKAMANVQGAHGGFHTFPCYIFKCKAYTLKRVLVDEDNNEIVSSLIQVPAGYKKAFNWPSFSEFMEYYNSLETGSPIEKWMRFKLPEVKVDQYFQNEDREVIGKEIITIPVDYKDYRIYGDTHLQKVQNEVSQIIEVRSQPIYTKKQKIDEEAELEVLTSVNEDIVL